MLLRHLIAITLLPFMAVVVVPRWLIERAGGGDARWVAGLDLPAAPLIWTERWGGLLLAACGFALFSWCAILLAQVGKGTLAPWNPTRHLVVAGPYRYVRNPMIGAVLLMLIGEAVMFRSRPIAIWASIFFLVNHFYFLLIEEPGLGRRLGEPYQRHRASVPRWFPRRRPWEP